METVQHLTPLPVDDAISVTVEAAIDIGNARTVAIVRDAATDRVTEIVLPSALSLRGASSRRVFEARSCGAGAWHTLGKDEHIVERNGIERFVGRLAVEAAQVASTARGSDERYADGWSLPFVLATLAAACPRATTITARIVTGVPAELWSQVHTSVVEALRGTHRYTYNGRSVVLKISEVIVKREGESAWRALPEGKREGRCFIINGGGRTFDVAALRDGEVVKYKTWDLGVETVLDDVDEALGAQGLRALTLRERGELLDALRDQQPYAIVVSNHRQRIDGIARDYLLDAATSFVQVLKSLGPMLAGADHVWLVGGAVYFMAARMRELLPVLQVPDRAPELITAYGYFAEFGPQALRRKPRR